MTSTHSMTAGGDAAVHGHVAPGYERVREAFAANFAQHDELGAAFAVVRDGDPVVDLWGGIADEASGRPWERGTLQLIYSGTKGLVALCLLMLVDRGELELDAPVARWWPEFAAEGKGGVTVAEIASHRARLPGIRTPVTVEDWLDDQRMAALLAAQPQESDPRAADIYHGLTYGWLCGELIRRAAGRSVGRFFAEEVAGPLGLELWIGLPPEHEPRVSTLRYGPNWAEAQSWDADAFATDELLACAWGNPTVFPPDVAELAFNRADLHAVEMPGAGGIGTARSIARLYGCLALGGELDGVRLLSAETLARGRQELTRRLDPLSGDPDAFGVGFALQTEQQAFGPEPDAFGHGGAGGSIHCAWPTQRVGLSYAMNTMAQEAGDPRSQTLLAALAASLDEDQAPPH